MPRCQKFYVPKDLKRKFCSDRCTDEHYKERGNKEGYFTNLAKQKEQRAE